jgi:VIT1/CCC1 family predicted Fe2+/Mn2+ transporter
MLSPALAHWVVEAALLYAAIGCGVAVGFLVAGIGRLDPASRGAYAFRPLLLPGLAALWPLVAWRWWRAVRA